MWWTKHQKNIVAKNSQDTKKMVIFYAGPIIETLLRKWFPLDVKPYKIVDQPQNGGEPNTNTSGLKDFLVESKKK